MKHLHRRNFFKLLAAGTAGIALPNIVNANTNSSQSNDTKYKLIHRKLGNTGIEVPIVSMGVMRADNPNLVKAAYKAGITHFDTAYVYQNGKNEEMLGTVMKEYKRDSFIMATKIYENMDENGRFTSEVTTDSFLEKLETSLKRLQMEYVDILYVHNIFNVENVMDERILNALRKAKEQGKIKFTGISTHYKEPEVIKATTESKFYDVILSSYNFQQTHVAEVETALAAAAKAGLGIIGMKTMAGGFFDKERTKPINATAAMKWALKNPNIHTVIPGFSTFEQLEENMAVMAKLKMSKKDKEALIIKDASGSLYCPGCDECRKDCIKNLRIPDIMRAYMYAYGYKDLKISQDLIYELGISSDPCKDCSECAVQCPKGFDVRSKISDIARLREVPREFVA